MIIILTYKLSADYVPVLSISLEVCISHQLVVLENGDPALLVFRVLTSLALLYRHRVRVEILQHYVVKVGHFTLLVELKFDVGLARLLLHSHCFV